MARASTSRQRFTLLRMGLLEHVERGWMSITDLGFYVPLLLLADPATGIVRTNAAQLARRCHCSRSLAQKHLRRLSTSNSKRVAYIKRFTKKHSTAPYPVLINRFFCTIPAQSGRYLNALDTVDWKAPVYEPVRREGEPTGTQRNEPGKVVSLLFRKPILKPKTRAQTPHATPPPPLNPETLSIQQRRKIEARDRREHREDEVRRAASAGQGPKLDMSEEARARLVQRGAQRIETVRSEPYQELDRREARLLGVKGRIQRALASYERRGVDPEVVRRDEAELDAVKHELAEVGTQKRALLEKAGELPPQKNT